MRLQKNVNRKVKGREYAKWIVQIPPERIQELGWNEGEELEEDIKDGQLVIAPLRDKATKSKRLSKTIGQTR